MPVSVPAWLKFPRRREWLSFVWACGSLLIASTGNCAQTADEAVPEHSRPNILLIITDQQHAQMMSCAGNQYLQTPAMDRLASEGIRFANAYVTNPVCVPSRISLATGVMAGRLGVFNNGMQAVIPPEVAQRSLGNLLKTAGYDTFYGGKVHLAPELIPQRAGYDEYFSDQREALPGACIAFIERERNAPFFAVASFINPHDICFAYSAFAGDSPQGKSSVEHLYRQASAMRDEDLPELPANFRIPELEPDALTLYANPKAVTPAITMRRVYDERQWRIYRWIYCRLTEQVDELMGRILAALDRNGLSENTLVIFTSDHGDMDACHRLASKGIFYDQAAKVPLLIRFPQATEARGLVQQQLVSSGLDILPTVCDFAGVPIPESLLGKSLRTFVEAKPPATWREYIITENHTGRMIRSSRYKYCVYKEGALRESLVDLKKDPGELHNLIQSADHTLVLEQHRKHLLEWIQQSRDEEAMRFAIPVDF